MTIFYVMSRESATQLIQHEDTSVLSIETPGITYRSQVPSEGWLNFKKMTFYDTDPGSVNWGAKDTLWKKSEVEVFSEIYPSLYVAGEILDFVIPAIQESKVFIVHCDAGISRSAAVGVFLRDFLGLKGTFENSDMFANRQLIKVLSEVYRSFPETR